MLLRDARQNRHRHNAVVSLVVALASLTVANGATPGELRGAIVDELGAEMWMSHVVIREDTTARRSNAESKSTIRTLTTSDNGKFSVALEPGFYDVCVMSDGFQPTCKKIKIIDARPTDEQFSLKVDLDVLGPVSHRVPIRER
jgi:hypothetical protein